MVSWGDLRASVPELADFGSRLLAKAPAYLGTTRASGLPRVHPVSPIVTDEGLFLFMEPTSPKAHDLRRRRGYALHNGVPDMFGTGGELSVCGEAVEVDAPEAWAQAAGAAGYEPEERYVLFELLVGEVRCHGYGDVPMPEPKRWSSPPPG